ncbi:MAG: 23S rRNA (adenine(2503)-C(2))-methyltransferase RlmN [Thermoanaerobacteraceae bacterium]|nr:23S rRNA (adenine(2503)-C(2))-methyltransferase RlmN [Thermoanaerobacteraceae bacterium]
MAHGVELHGLELHELKQLVRTLGEAEYRANQLFQWLHLHRVTDWAAMTNIPKNLRQQLAAVASLPSFSILRTLEDPEDGTTKLLISLPDGEKVECVLMIYGRGGAAKRLTACLSSQVGCPIGCSFCATGQGGFRRNLTAGEIILQVVALQHHLEGRVNGERISNVVFMGMGEPLLNCEAVLKARRILMHPQGWGIGHRRITISTCGVVPQIKRLALETPPPELAISLHATTDAVRNRLVPLNRRYPLGELLAACREYAQVTGRRITFEYVLIKGINDSPADADRLAWLVQGTLAYINLLVFNPVPGLRFQAPAMEDVRAFAGRLRQRGVEVAVRESRGCRIGAACGQLRAEGV